MNTPRWVVVIGLVMALALPAMPASAARSASIRLTSPTPNPGPVYGDVVFELVIDVTDIVPGVAGAEIYLAYEGPVAPPASPLAVAQALPDFFGVSDISIKEILPASDPRCKGSLNPCIRLVVAGPPQITHAGAAARFFFQCTAEGTARFTVLDSTLVDADGFHVPHTPASAVSVPCVYNPPVKGKVLRQGVPANPNPGGGSLACSVVRLEPPLVGPVFTNSLGDFTVLNVPVGTYKLVAEYSGYMAPAKTITIVAGGPPVIDVGTTILRGGDANNDMRINILDIGEVISEFGAPNVNVRSDPQDGCADLDEPADINDSGAVNISDLAITSGNWGCIGPAPWSPDLTRCFP